MAHSYFPALSDDCVHVFAPHRVMAGTYSYFPTLCYFC